MKEFTDTEKEKLSQLRAKIEPKLVHDYQKDDDFLIKWLRARSMNVDKAYKMLSAHLEWRIKENVDGIEEREKYPEKYRSKFPYAVCGFDEDGCPIILVPSGRQDFRTLIETESISSLHRLNIIMMETFCALMRKNAKKVGKPVNKLVEIIDLEGMDYSLMTSRKYLQFATEGQKIFNDNYPEMIKKAFVVNTPKVVTVMFNMMKPMIPKETLERIEIFGHNKSEWKDAIRKAGLPLEKIPPYWGGTMEGSDEVCSQSDIWVYGKLNLNFFNIDSNDVTYTKKQINARDSYTFEITVDEDNSQCLQWTFKTEAHDIGFSVLFNGEEVVPKKRYEASRSIQFGSYLCEAKGTYQVLFDNKYSYTRSKTVHYEVKLVPKEIIQREDQLIEEFENEIKKNLNDQLSANEFVN